MVTFLVSQFTYIFVSKFLLLSLLHVCFAQWYVLDRAHQSIHFAQFVFCVCVCMLVNYFIYFLWFFKTGYFVALKPVLELAFVGQTGLKLTEICLPLPPQVLRLKARATTSRLYVTFELTLHINIS